LGKGRLERQGFAVWLALVLCLALLPSKGLADSRVYRCDKAGTASFSDQPCTAGAKSCQVTISNPAASSVYDFQVSVAHYPVFGRDYNSLKRSIRERGPIGE
jgi:hypothetical protein